jgi:hypothetical protein
LVVRVVFEGHSTNTRKQYASYIESPIMAWRATRISALKHFASLSPVKEHAQHAKHALTGGQSDVLKPREEQLQKHLRGREEWSR